MEQRELDEINRFLASVGKATLFEYFDVSPDAPPEQVQEAVRKRRTWAQGQQANPKYRQEAIWVIKNVGRCRQAMVEQRESYLEALEGQSQGHKLEVLRLFIMGTLAEGVLSERGEQAIHDQGRMLGLPSPLVEAEIERLLGDHKALRATSTEQGQRENGNGRDRFVDHYAVLEVHPDADLNTLERAYRDRYHWARQLSDSRQAEEIYARLDDAWNVLKDPTSRAPYDERRREVLGAPLPGALPAPGPATPPEPDLSLAARRISFAEEEAEDSGRVPRPPADIGGTTLGLTGSNRSALPSRPARLEVDAPETLHLRARRRPIRSRLTIRKGGQAPMHGRVMVDRDWVEVEPVQLDPEAAEQQITITVHPRRMPRRKAVALVTVLTDDGQRRSVTLEAERPGNGPFLAAALVLLGLGGLGYLASREDLWREPPPPAPVTTRLNVEVDPPAGEIYVNDKLVNSQGHVTLDQLSPNAVVPIRVELDGFRSWSDEVTLGAAGEQIEVRPVLQLTDRMSYQPAAGAVAGALPPEAVQAALASRRIQIQACFAEHGRAAPGTVAALDLRAYVNNRGRIVGVDFTPQGFEPGRGLYPCIKRQLRSLQLPLIQGDYAMFRDQLHYTVPEAVHDR